MALVSGTSITEKCPIRTRYDLAAVTLVAKGGGRYKVPPHAFTQKTHHPDTIGGYEWHGPCPECGGRDRLLISNGLFRCRQCGLSGVVLPDDPVHKPAMPPRPIGQNGNGRKRKSAEEKLTWLRESGVVEKAHRRLLQSREGLAFVKRQWGFTREIVEKYTLGLIYWRPGKQGDEIPAIFFPHYFNGKLIGGSIRLMKGTDKYGRYRPYPALGYAFPYIIVGKEKAILLEGQAKAITVAEALGFTGATIISIPGVDTMSGGAMEEYAEWLVREHHEVYILFDKRADAVMRAAQRTARRLLRTAEELGTMTLVKICVPIGKPDDALRLNRITPRGLWVHIANGPYMPIPPEEVQ